MLRKSRKQIACSSQVWLKFIDMAFSIPISTLRLHVHAVFGRFDFSAVRDARHDFGAQKDLSPCVLAAISVNLQ